MQNQICYDSQLDRLVIPESYTRPDYYEPSWNSIYDGCADDIAKAFNLNASKIIEMSEAREKHKATILKTFKESAPHKDNNCLIPSSGRKAFATEFRQVLKEIEKSRCFYLKDRAGNSVGVRPPKGWYAIAGTVLVPWHLMYIDYSCQRWTDALNVLSILLKFESQCAYGVTARFDPDGTVVDVNEGRHGAMAIALTGAEYCWATGPVSGNLATNYDIFEIKNIIPKKTELNDEVRIKTSRSSLRLESNQTIRTDVGGNIEDQEAYELTNLLSDFNAQFIPSDKRKGTSGLDKGDIYRVDKFVNWYAKDPNYTSLKANTREFIDSFIVDGLVVLTDIFDNGHVPHETMWGILELFKVSGVKFDDKKRREKMQSVLKDVLDENYDRASEHNGFKRAMQFYKDFNKVRNNIDHSGSTYAGYIKGNNYVATFLAMAIYSMIQESVGVRESDKALFVEPQINDNGRKIALRDKDGDLFSFSKLLAEDEVDVNFDENFEDSDDEMAS